MKTLYLVRHAKSSWDDQNLDDFDRPLNERGMIDAPKMGKRLKEKEVLPQMIFSSSAVRALSTARIIAHSIGFPEGHIHQDRTLYHAEEKRLLKYLRHCQHNYDSIMIVGHNPGLTIFANELMDKSIDNIPTTGVVALEFVIHSWKDIKEGTGELKFFDFPKHE